MFENLKTTRRGTTASFAAICFNSTGELLCLQGAGPDYCLSVWRWREVIMMVMTMMVMMMMMMTMMMMLVGPDYCLSVWSWRDVDIVINPKEI